MIHNKMINISRESMNFPLSDKILNFKQIKFKDSSKISKMAANIHEMKN